MQGKLPFFGLRAAIIMILGFALIGLAACGGSSGSGTPAPMPEFAGCNMTIMPDPTVDSGDPVRFVVVGTQAFMDGTIDGATPMAVQTLIAANPGLQEIVLGQVPGSADDGSNLAAARMVRAAGLNTRTEAASVIASGGVDFFLAGVKRVADPASEVRVHSWADGNNMLGRDLPATSCEHAPYVAYYRELGLADPSGFYFFTLQSGLPTVDISAADRVRFGVNTP